MRVSGGDEAARDNAQTVDWNRLFALAQRHRVEGLAWRALTAIGIAVPEPVASTWGAAAAAIAQAGMRNLVESRRLLAAFIQADIPLLFLKGLTLGKLAYGDPFVKMGWDIDVLVAPSHVGQAAQQLTSLGYRRIVPGDGLDTDAWHRRNKESVWQKDDAPVFVELHSRLADSPALIPSINMSSPHQSVEVTPGLTLPTLARDELFAYLCVHGSSSAWFRLKWINDLAALIRHEEPSEIERLFDHAVRLGAGRASAQALLLIDRLYAINLGPLRNRLLTDRANRWLLGSALFYLDGPLSRREPTETLLGTLAIRTSQLLLRSGWLYKIGEGLRQGAEILRGGRGA